jgi:hypothetical protein
MITLWPAMVSSWKPLSSPRSSCSLANAGVEMRCTTAVSSSITGTMSSATSINCQSSSVMTTTMKSIWKTARIMGAAAVS